VLEESVGPAQPAARLRLVSTAHQVERQPERAPRGPPNIAALRVELLGALQRSQALFDVAEQVSRGRQQFQILRGQGSGLVGQQQSGVGVRPRQPPGGLAAPRKRTVPAHRLSRLQAGGRSLAPW
jgi:hypothetical protein